MTGAVLEFERSYGWIAPDTGGKDVFVHWTAIESDGYKTLYAGDVVSFEIDQTDKGPKARNVRLIL